MVFPPTSAKLCSYEQMVLSRYGDRQPKYNLLNELIERNNKQRHNKIQKTKQDNCRKKNDDQKKQ